MFLRNFSHVPDDRLTWTPTPDSKSALRIAAHTALYYHRFATMLQNRTLPKVEDLDAWLQERADQEKAITDRAEIEPIFRAGFQEFVTALEGVTLADLSLELDSGQGWTLSLLTLVMFPGWHATLHTGQIDYLQTCWGDQHVHLSAKS